MKRFLRKKKLKTRQEVADRVRLFFERHLTVEKCLNYINRIHEVKFKKKLKLLLIFNNDILI